MRRLKTKLPKGYIVVDQAAKILGVTKATIQTWAISKKLTYTEHISPKTGRTERFILKSSLKGAMISTCGFCGKRFKAKRPMRAEYCNRLHRYASTYKRKQRVMLQARHKKHSKG
jgi:transposase